MKITKTQLKQIIKEELKQVLNEEDMLGPEVAGYVEKAIAALAVLQKTGGDMGQYKKWAQANLKDPNNALEDLLNADSPQAVRTAASRMHRYYTRGIDFEGTEDLVQYLKRNGRDIADHPDADQIIPTLKAKSLLDKLASILTKGLGL